jgi:hypothetical protein
MSRTQADVRDSRALVSLRLQDIIRSRSSNGTDLSLLEMRVPGPMCPSDARPAIDTIFYATYRSNDPDNRCELN